MDQTKFINTYIANLAEQLKALTLDNIMLKTQLALANETIAELNAQLQSATENITTDETESEVLPMSDYK